MQRQLAIKIIIIFVIGLLILVPVSMVKSKVYERQNYLAVAKSAVAQSWTGRQLVFTPIIAIPYRISAARHTTPQSGFYVEDKNSLSDELHLILPTQLSVDIDVKNNSVFKGIYEVPIYKSAIQASGVFSSQEIRQAISRLKAIRGFESMSDPYIGVYISDVRGINAKPKLVFDKHAITLNPGSQIPSLSSGLHGVLPEDLLPLDKDKTIEFTFDLSLKGMDGLSFIPFADNARVNMSSDWPHPEFIGASLPAERDISASGFSASWSLTRYSINSTGLLKQCIENNHCSELTAYSSGVNFIEPVDVYLQSERSIKYAMLFIGLSFVTFFIFEHIKTVRIHPIQYAFVGLAIAVFYLLLISLAEHIAFHWAYLISVIICTSLLLFYVKHMFKRLSPALLFALMITSLYGLLYVIVQAEDFALLMGSLLVFTVLSAFMVITRKIDWYDLSLPELNTSAKKYKNPTG